MKRFIVLVFCGLMVLSVGLPMAQGATTGKPIHPWPLSPNESQCQTQIPINPTLTWDIEQTNEQPSSYTIYLSTNKALVEAKDSSVIVGTTTDQFIPTSLNYLTNYAWKVVAHYSNSRNEESEIWCFYTVSQFPPAGPTNFNISLLTFRQLQLAWDYVSSRPVEFLIQKFNPDTNDWNAGWATDKKSIVLLFDPNEDLGKHLSFRVRAQEAVTGNSEYTEMSYDIPQDLSSLAKPDLIISKLSIQPESITAHQPFIITTCFKNIGQGMAPGDFDITYDQGTGEAFSKSIKRTLDIQDAIWDPEEAVIRPGAEVCLDSEGLYVTDQSGYHWGKWNYFESGMYQFKVSVDPQDNIPEASETNNTQQLAVTVTVAPATPPLAPNNVYFRGSSIVWQPVSDPLVSYYEVWRSTTRGYKGKLVGRGHEGTSSQGGSREYFINDIESQFGETYYYAVVSVGYDSRVSSIITQYKVARPKTWLGETENKVEQLPFPRGLIDGDLPSGWQQREKALVTSVDKNLIKRLHGYILLQVQEHGEAWYVSPTTDQKYYLEDGAAAYTALKKFGLGITNTDLSKIPVGIEDRFKDTDSDSDGLPDKLEEGLGLNPQLADTDGDGHADGLEVRNGYNPRGVGTTAINRSLVNQLKGKILLQVQSSGQAWYVNPQDGKRYYLRDGEAAYQIMRFLSLGITDVNLRMIAVGDL